MAAEHDPSQGVGHSRVKGQWSDGSPAIPIPAGAKVIPVMVTVDTDELRTWADRHADAGNHGVAHVLYKAAADGESLTEQALAAARREGADLGRRAVLDPGAFVKRDRDDDGDYERLDQWQARALEAALGSTS